MENRTINLGVISEVAEALKELKEKFVFIGGAVVSVYADDPAADEIRPTADIDMTINIMSFLSWTKVQKRLSELSFYPDPKGHSICSYKYKDIPVDILTGDIGDFGSVNRWFKIGFKDLQTVSVKDQYIQVFSVPCYLAIKFEAFNNRGKDYRTSHDFEDIIYVIDNRINLVDEISLAHKEVREYLQDEIEKLINNPGREELISAHLHPLVVDDRYQIVVNKMMDILRIEK